MLTNKSVVHRWRHYPISLAAAVAASVLVNAVHWLWW